VKVPRPAQRSGVSRIGRYFSRKRGLAEFIAGGPLAAVLDELAAALEAKGYCASTIHGYVRAARHVTYALERRQLARRDLSLTGLRAFARTHGDSCRCPHPESAPSANFHSCMEHLLPILQRHGLAAKAARQPPFAEVLGELDQYMVDVRGLSAETRALHLRSLQSVLTMVMRGGGFEPARLTAPALQAYVAERAVRYSAHTVARTVVAIRCLLRFLQTRGVDTSIPLTTLKGPRQTHRLSSDKALTLPQTRALFAPLRGSRDPIAMRDLAILLLLGQVGLRRSDVATLQLEDFHGRASTLTVRRSKSRRGFELPVPGKARDAVLRYVRDGRPAVETTALFVTHAFPYDRGVSAKAVSAVVQRAFRRSGIEHPSHGAHVLRHTLATQLVAARQPLKAIADVMRHKQIDTTAGYVRTDLDRLRSAVFPWPKERDGVGAGAS
jgi:site-specific recombinase XerD